MTHPERRQQHKRIIKLAKSMSDEQIGDKLGLEPITVRTIRCANGMKRPAGRPRKVRH